jgi:hypothetical protein
MVWLSKSTEQVGEPGGSPKTDRRMESPELQPLPSAASWHRPSRRWFGLGTWASAGDKESGRPGRRGHSLRVALRPTAEAAGRAGRPVPAPCRRCQSRLGQKEIGMSRVLTRTCWYPLAVFYSALVGSGWARPRGAGQTRKRTPLVDKQNPNSVFEPNRSLIICRWGALMVGGQIPEGPCLGRPGARGTSPARPSARLGAAQPHAWEKPGRRTLSRQATVPPRRARPSLPELHRERPVARRLRGRPAASKR